MSGSLAYYLGGYISTKIVEYNDTIHLHSNQLIELQKEGILQLYKSINIKSYKGLVEGLLSQFPKYITNGEFFPHLNSNDFIILQNIIDKYKNGATKTNLAAGFVSGLFEAYYGVYNPELLQMANKKPTFKRIFREPAKPQIWLSEHHTGFFDKTNADMKLVIDKQLLQGLDKFIVENPASFVAENRNDIFHPYYRKSKNVEGIVENANRFLNEQIENHSKSLAKNYQIAAEELEKKAQEFQDNFEMRTNEVASNVEAKSQDAIENALQGVKAEGILRQAFTLWENKESTHRANFKNGIRAFIGLIVISAICLWLGWGTIKEAVGDAANATVAKDSITIATAQLLSRIVLISLPFATLLWVLRAILRWANLNLSLAEDAAQRSVLAQTYVNLLAHGHIDQDKDREIMLSALFRPLPGLKDIDIPPMSIREYVDPNGKHK